MARQHGNSGRGPDDLDQAKRNLGQDAETDDDVKAHSLASGNDDDEMSADDDDIDSRADELLDEQRDGLSGDTGEGRPDRLYADTLVDEEEMAYGDEHGAPPRRT